MIMKGVLLIAILSVLTSNSHSFVVGPSVRSPCCHFPVMMERQMSYDEETLAEPTIPDVDDDNNITTASATLQMPTIGSPDELMYTLGVNLARQLGDVRPLVETPQEMSLVARGLLDTVVGRLTDADQRALLGRRGSELNQMIVERA